MTTSSTSLDRSLKDKGRNARKRAEARALKATGQARVRAEDWYPEIERLADEGISNAEIAAAINLSMRRVQQIRTSEGFNPWNAKLSPPKEPQAVAEEYRPMLERTADGFRLFFEYFSGLELSDLGYDMIEAALQNSNVMINVPPRHAKTMIIAVWLPVWLIVLDRNEQIIIVSDTGMHAKQVAAEIAAQLEWNKELVDAFGRFAPERSKDAPWRPSQGEMVVLGRTKPTRNLQFSILSRGAGQQILGREATWAILDDITSQQITESDREREKLGDWVRQNVFSRLERGADSALAGHALVVGQRVHLNDLYGEFELEVGLKGSRKGKRLWHVIKKPAVLRWPDEDPENPEPIVLWPQKWSFDALMESYDRMGHDAFEKMYQQNPMPEGSRFVQPEWLEGCRDYERPGYKSVQGDAENYFPMVRVASFDPSPTKENALIVMDMVVMRDAFACAIIEAKTWKGNMRDFVSEMERVIGDYAPDYTIVERSTVTNWLIQDPLYEQFRYSTHILEHTTGVNKGDGELGVMSLAADFESGRIRLPYGDVLGRNMSKLIEDQALVYGNRRPDDLLMAIWFVKWNYRRLRPRNVMPEKIGGDRAGNGGTFSYIRNALKAQDPERQRMLDYRRNRGH